MEQFAFCYAVITAFCLMFAGIVASKMNEGVGSEVEVRYFRYMIYAFMAFCVGELVWSVGNFKLLSIPVPILSLMSMISMIALGFITYFWFAYGETKMGHRFLERRGLRVILFIPLAVAIALYLVSPFTGWMYYYNENGQFVQGPLYALAIPLEQIYLIIVSIHALIRTVKEKGEKRREYFNIFAFLIVPALACIFDTFVPTMPVIAPAIFSSIFFVFLGLQESQIFNDALTGLNNRRRADAYLDEIIEDATPKEPLYVFMIDVNRFKNINDTYGHIEGDHALRTVAEAVKRTCADLRAFASRWGGDEFLIVAEGRYLESPTALVNVLKTNVEKQRQAAGIDYALDISVGFSVCTSPDMSKEALEEQADDMLYQEKKLRYASETVTV